MKSKIKAIFFDMGGVLVIPKPGYEHINKRWIETIDMSAEWNEMWFEVMRGKGDLGDFNKMLVERKVFEKEFVEILSDREKREHINLELVKIIKKLRKKYKVGLLTNNWAENIEYQKKHFGNYSIFDVVVSSHEVGMTKPDKEIFIEAAKRIGCKLSECVFVDDWDKNVEAANKLGMKGIQFINNDDLILSLEKLKIL